MYLAALKSVPEQLYEAAAIDGASAWQKFVHITLPMMRNIIAITVLFSLIVTFANFDIVQIMTAGGPRNMTHMFATYSFLLGIRSGDLPLGAATSLFMFPILAIAAVFILRGVRTLGVRMEKAQENGVKLAEFLARHPKVVWVRYPGLPDHPQHEIARRQMDGFGAMISFGVSNGLQGGISLMNHVQLITRAVSLGGVESLIEHPASMTHAGIPRKERDRIGIADELIRFSVGCEDFEDLRDDLDQALRYV
jgi:O-acetylhomoserine/O-acetylserine sulfhydrylase-like pyridoxal-dependent enzyme